MFTSTQQRLLTHVVNRLVPAEDGFPGAGDLGVAAHIDQVVGESAALRKLFLPGLAQIEVTAARTKGKAFGALSAGDKDLVLREVEREQPEFFRALVQHTYNSYYTSPAIFPLIGYEGHPPQPQGYPVRSFDPRLLDNVRKRPPLYRQA